MYFQYVFVRQMFSPFSLLLDAKNRLSISEMVSTQYLQKVWAVLKKSYLRIYTEKLRLCLIGHPFKTLSARSYL